MSVIGGLNKSEIRIGTLDQTEVIGAALFGPLTATLPTAAEMDVTEGYTGIGYLVEDGFTVALGQTTTAIREHNLGNVRVISNGDEKSITIVAMQTNADNLKIMVGDDHVTETAATSTHGKIVKADFGNWVGKEGRLQIRLKDGDAYGVWCIPVAQLAEVAEVEVNASGVMGWSMKFIAMDNPDGPDIFFISDDGQVSA